jgi:hypothetical protein
VLDAEYLSSIAMALSIRSDTDLISGRTITTATRRSVLPGDAPVARSAPSREAARVAAVIRSATTVAAATCSGIVLPLEFGAGRTVGGEFDMFGPVGPAAAAALLSGSSFVFNEGGGIGRGVAESSAFAAMTLGFAVLLARGALVSLACLVGGLVLNDASLTG